MKAAAAPLLLAPLAACAGLADTPSLAPRPIEKADFSTPAPPPPEAAPADPAHATRIAALVEEARAGDAVFDREAKANATALRTGARAASGSDAWIAAQTARSALEAARQRSADALAALDQLLVEAAASGAETDAIETARSEAETIVARQTAVLEGLGF